MENLSTQLKLSSDYKQLPLKISSNNENNTNLLKVNGKATLRNIHSEAIKSSVKESIHYFRRAKNSSVIFTVENIFNILERLWPILVYEQEKLEKCWLCKLPKNTDVEKVDLGFNKNLNLFINKMAK